MAGGTPTVKTVNDNGDEVAADQATCGFYNLGIMSLSVSASWFAAALLIIASLPLGLIFARILTDKTFRYCT